ncbi:gcn5-related n-acetyltransferase [Xylariaceae sp. FL1019]|nr:gcn5-related n-acetyltransferase [Xylariaceae sp. FL1019]
MPFAFPPASYEIRSPRLIIRSPVQDDCEAFIALLSNARNLPPGVTEVMPNLTPEGQSARLKRWRTSASEGRNAFLAIALRETNELVGYIGFNCFRTKEEYEGTEPERQEPLLSGPEGRYLTDLGINTDIKHRRKGYSSEVLCLAPEFAFKELQCQLVRMETSLLNEPWRAVMRDVGFGHLEKESIATYNDELGFVYIVDRSTWERTKGHLLGRRKWPL